MKVKELRQLLKNLPSDMEVLIDTGIVVEPEQSRYSSVVIPVRKVKTKLHKRIFGRQTVQSRPHKDEKAILSLIIE